MAAGDLFVPATLSPKNAGNFEVCRNTDVKGARQFVASIANLTDGTIRSGVRTQGMLATCLDTGVEYELAANLTTWTERRLNTGSRPTYPVLFYPSGTSDDWARLNALTAVYSEIFLMPGTFYATVDGAWADGTTVHGGPGRRIIQTLSTENGHAAIKGIEGVESESTTLSVRAEVGDSQIVVAGLFRPADVKYGSFVVLTNVDNECSGALYKVLSKSGSGPYTIKLERGIKRARPIGCIASFRTRVPQDIVFDANGTTISGTGDRFVELQSGYRIKVFGLHADDVDGWVTGPAMSLEIPSYSGEFDSCTLNPGTHRSLEGFILESNELSLLTKCIVNNMGEAFRVVDSYDCVGSLCQASDIDYGLKFATGQASTTEHTGSNGCVFRDCTFNHVAYSAITHEGYSANCWTERATINNAEIAEDYGASTSCGSKNLSAINCPIGSQITEAAVGVKIVDPSTSLCSAPMKPATSCKIDGHTSVNDSTPFWCQTSGVVVDYSNFDISNTTVANARGDYLLVSNGRVRLKNGKITGVMNNYPRRAITCNGSGIVEHSDVEISGFGGHDDNGGGVGVSGTGTIIKRGKLISDAYIQDENTGPHNTGSIMLVAGIKSVSFPDILAGDVPKLTLTAIGGEWGVPVVTVTAGVGFDVTSQTTADTSTYSYEI
jgi:hypothetical protein